YVVILSFFFQAEDGIRDFHVTGVQTCALPILGLIVLAVATLLALILGPLFSWRVTRSITHPLRSAVDVAEAVARRDLSADVAARGRDEIGQLLNALAAMTRNLRSALGEVRKEIGRAHV